MSQSHIKSATRRQAYSSVLSEMKLARARLFLVHFNAGSESRRGQTRGQHGAMVEIFDCGAKVSKFRIG